MIATRLLFAFIFLYLPLAAQEDSLSIRLLRPGQLRSFGRNAMMQQDYNSATIYLSRYLNQRPDNAKVAFWLAESYRLSRDYAQALEWYRQSYSLSANTYSEALYWQAVLMKMHGDCDGAREKFTAFRKQSGSDDRAQALKRQMKAELAGCDSLVGQQSANRVVLLHLDTTINKPHIEAAPLYLDDQTVIYSSLRVEEPVYRHEHDTSVVPSRELYLAKKSGDHWKFGNTFDAPFSEPGENLSSVTLSADGNRAYFSRCAVDWKNKMICQLFVSDKKNGNWTQPINLGKEVNLSGTSNSQPAVGVTSKGVEIIYFVSERKGGKGGKDIWYTTWHERRKAYTAPRNAGSAINTRQDEMSPWYDQEYRTLYFSSDGHPGIGGMDVYRSIGEVRKFTIPENLREPINSGYDDIHYVLAPGRDHGMFASNRKGGNAFPNSTCCDDLYEFKKTELVRILIEGNVYEQDTAEKKPIVNGRVELQLVDPVTGEGIVLKEIPLNEKGGYSVEVESGNNYKITGTADGYLRKSASVNTTGIAVTTTLKKDLYLPELSLESYRLENVYYETDKHELTPVSRNVLDTTLLIILQENPNIKIEIMAHTDDVGTDSYNMGLSQRRAEGVVKYLITKGIDKARLTSRGYGETKPIAPNFNPDGTPNPSGRDKNRRTEFRVVGQMPVKVIRPDDEEED